MAKVKLKGATERTHTDMPVFDKSVSNSPLFAWSFAIGLVLVGACGLFLWQPWHPAVTIEQYVLPVNPFSSVDELQPKPLLAGDAAAEAMAQANQQKFEFYTALPKQKIVTQMAILNDKSPQTLQQSAEATAIARSNGSLAEAAGGYWLHMGSYTEPAVAEQMLASVLIAGVHAQVFSQVVNKKLYYRVVSGPFSSQSQARAQQQTLRYNNISAVITAP